MKQWRYRRCWGVLFRKTTIVLQVRVDTNHVTDLGRGEIEVFTTYEWRDARPEDLPFGSFERAGWSA